MGFVASAAGIIIGTIIGRFIQKERYYRNDILKLCSDFLHTTHLLKNTPLRYSCRQQEKLHFGNYFGAMPKYLPWK